MFREFIGVPEVPRFNSVLFGGACSIYANKCFWIPICVLVLGLLGSLFSLLQFLSSPLLGTLSDVFGRRHLMLLSAVIFVHALYIF